MLRRLKNTILINSAILLNFILFNFCYANGQSSGGFRLDNLSKFSSLEEAIKEIPKILPGIAGMIFIIVTVIGGIMYLTAAGNEEQAKKAKNTLLWGIIGMIIAALGFLAVEFFYKGIMQ